MTEDDLPVASAERAWAVAALARLREQAGEAPLVRYRLPEHWGIELLLQDESRRPSGSLKHTLMRGLFEEAVAGGVIGPGTTVVEASAGNAAVSGAYFARLLGLPFVAVVPARTAASKKARIERYGGQCRPFDPPLAIYKEARRYAGEIGGHYLDHFAAAARCGDWRDPARVAGGLLPRVEALTGAPPSWVVTGAGTGHTSAAVGRYVRHAGLPTRLAVVDPEHSAYLGAWSSGFRGYGTGMPSRVEGIGRPRVEPAFLPGVIDLMIGVPDAASVAGMLHLAAHTELRPGPSTGASFWGALRLAERMRRRGETGVIATLAGDGAEAYEDTYYAAGWRADKGLDPSSHLTQIEVYLTA